MGLFDRFKKKSKITEHSSANLEALLKKAAKEPAYRSEFYKQLLKSELVVMTRNDGPPKGKFVAKEDTKISILSFEEHRIPVFTSIERIFDKEVVKQQVSYAKLQADVIFKMLPGKTLLLNPYSDYGKELLPNEIERLLSGGFFTDAVKPVVVTKNSAFAIGQPAKYPTEVVKSLIELFSNKPNVYAAYLGWIQNSSTDEPPHLIFGIDAVNDWDNIVQEAGFTVHQILNKNDFVDFIQISNGNSISDYFLKSTTPFYKK
jgi:hypothetical protein